jgi:hypothetical protein
LDWTAIGEYVLVLCRFPDSGLVQIDAVTIAGTKGPVTMAVPKLLIDGGMARSGIRQGRFISFAEDSRYLSTVPYTGKAVNQVTLWKVNLEKGAIEFLGHYDRHLSPVWKSVTEMFPPSTNTVAPSTTTPVPRPKSATPILPPPTNVPPSSLKSR